MPWISRLKPTTELINLDWLKNSEVLKHLVRRYCKGIHIYATSMKCQHNKYKELVCVFGIYILLNMTICLQKRMLGDVSTVISQSHTPTYCERNKFGSTQKIAIQEWQNTILSPIYINLISLLWKMFLRALF